MKRIILILLVGFLVGCSHNTSLKKTNKANNKSQISDERANNNHISSAFKSTLSSFIPVNNDGLNGDMPWKQILTDFYMNSNIMYYILFAISFITIGLLIFLSIRNKDIFKNKNKFNI